MRTSSRGAGREPGTHVPRVIQMRQGALSLLRLLQSPSEYFPTPISLHPFRLLSNFDGQK